MIEVEEARVFAGGVRWLAGAMTVACAMLVGPSAPRDALVGGALPADAVREVVPHRVMTWNLCNPCEESNVDRAAEIAAYAPQVIGFQEACASDVARIRNELERRYGLVYHVAYGTVLQDWGRCGGVPWSPDGYGQALLSAGPITGRINVEYPDGGSEDRGYMAITTSVGGRSVRVFNTHLAERRQESVRADQVGMLAAEVARHDRAIVLGDFNAVPDAPELAPMWALAVDTDPQCHPSPADGCQTTTDWHSKFDYVFLRGVTALDHHVQPSAYSDHHLLDTDLDVTQGVAPAAGTAGTAGKR